MNEIIIVCIYIMPKTLRSLRSLRGSRGSRSSRSLRGSRSLKRGKASIAGLAKLVIPKFLEMINTIKIYHWKTSSYSTHKATDQLFADLNTKTDEFVEVLLGKSEINRDSVLNFPGAKIVGFSTNGDCRKQVEGYKAFLLALPQNKNFRVMENVDLLAIRDDIMGLLNQFLYLLTLH